MVSAPAGVLSSAERPRRSEELVAFVDWFIVWPVVIRVAIFAKNVGLMMEIRTCSSIDAAPRLRRHLKC